MSEHTIPNPTSIVEGHAGLGAAVAAAIRAPVRVEWRDPSVVYVFVPDLTTAEASTFADLVSVRRANVVDLSEAEFLALKPHLATVRSILPLTRAQWRAMDPQAREDMTFELLTALARVNLRLIRD
jgi:hypothetical protein